MHNKLVGMAATAAAHAPARAAVSDDRRAHFGIPLLVLLHRGGMACWQALPGCPLLDLRDEGTSPGAAHVNDCSAHMDSCTAKALAGAGIESFCLMWRACMAV